MYRLIIFLIQFIIILFLITLIFSNPFIVSFDINNYKYSFSSNIFAGVLISFLIIFYLIIYFFFKSRFSINKYILKNKYKKIEKGYFYFVEAMIAVANKDNQNAIKSHKKMLNYLKDDQSLSLLLKSEVYKIEKKTSELNQVYETMLKSKKTEALGYRGLMENNLINEDYHHAFLYGEKLFNLNPKIEKLYDTLVYIAARTKNWTQLINISDKAYSKRIIQKDLYNENKSIALYEIAKIKSEVDLKEASKNIIKAINFKQNFTPYIKLHLDIILKTNDIYLLKKMIRKYWNSNPSSDLRLILTDIILKSKLDDLNFIYQIIKNNGSHEESKKILIFFAIQKKEWNLARDKITGLIGSNPSKEICVFMADIELGDKNDKQKSDAWMMRSQNAYVEKIWTCKITNQSQDNWGSLSNSGYFNSLVLTNTKLLSGQITQS